MNQLKSLLLAVALIVSSTVFASGDGPVLTPAPDLSNDKTALQHGAKLFVNYCLNCHSASSMRYNRLKDIGLSDEHIKKNLLFSAEKVGDTMEVALQPKDAKAWFGALPPDLSVIARAKSSADGTGADYIYTYLRSFYRDSSRPTGWNNVASPNIAMPHALWDLQPARSLEKTEVVHLAHDDKAPKNAPAFEKIVTTYDASGLATTVKTALPNYSGHASVSHRFIGDDKDLAAQQRFDHDAASLTAFMQYMADPSASTRQSMGVWVLLFLGLFILLAYLLNKEYWKDIK
jgi:ubiquinol-cytochrome c reductase cytochrome c1 subunit